MTLVSYVVTVYNKAPYLKEVISALSQQKGDYSREYIFVDDGSSDDSLAILHELTKDLSNSQVITQQNQGPAIAFNNGLKIATGEWIYMLDGDDALLPDSTNILLEQAAKYNAKLVRGLTLDKNVNGEVVVYEDALAKALDKFAVGASAVIFDRILALEVGGCDERVFIQDYSIAIRLSAKTKIVQINQLLARNLCFDQDNRLSSNKAKEMRSEAAARLNYVSDNINSLAYRYKYIAFNAALRRAWSFCLKREKFWYVFSKHFIRYLVSRIDVNYTNNTIQQWMQESLEVYK